LAGTRGRKRAVPADKFKNHLLAAYAVARAGYPYGAFALQITLSRSQGGKMLDGHDSQTGP
jgi:hypothetical protein